MRRSNSSSNIPMPRSNLFGVRESRVSKASSVVDTKNSRSQSTSRLSQRDSFLPTGRHSRKSSLERKSNILGLPKTTPLNKPRAGRSGSLQRITPNSGFSQRSRGTPTCAQSAVKERKTIQKLSTDKRWLEEQYVKVQDFIANSSLFDLSIVKPNEIKSFTNKTFIYISSILLGELFPKIKITTENFKEVIPEHLKILRYPGTLTNSVLKTVNTTNSWPVIIGTFSWLIDKVNLGRCAEDTPDLDHLDPEERQKFLLIQNALNFVTERYENFNDGNKEEKIEEANKKYTSNLANILDVDYEKLNALRDDLSKKEQYKEKEEEDIKHLTAEKLRLKSEMDQMNEIIENFTDEDASREHSLNNELQHLEDTLKKLRERKEIIKQDIAQLEESIKVQPCTFIEKKQLLQQIEEIKNENLVKSEKIEHAQGIKNKFDHRLAEDISKIQDVVIHWNRSLMEICIKKPELKKLLLREKGFHDPKFLDELEEVLKYKEQFETDALNTLAHVKEDLRRQKTKKQEVENEIEEMLKAVENLNQEYSSVIENIKSIQIEIKEIVLKSNENEKASNEQIKKLKECPELRELEKMISISKEKEKKAEEEAKKFGKKMLSFFVDMNNQVMNNIKEMDTLRKDVEKRVQERILSKLEKEAMITEATLSLETVAKSFEQTVL